MSDARAERESTLEQVVASGAEPDTSGGAGAASGAERGRSPSGAEDAAPAPPAASSAPGDASAPAAAPPDAGSPVFAEAVEEETAEALGELRGLAGWGRSRRARPARGRRLVPPDTPAPSATTPEQRLLLLDTWQRSGLPGRDFAALVGVSRHNLYAWKKRFDQEGPAGLLDQPKGGPRGSRLPELTKRTIKPE